MNKKLIGVGVGIALLVSPLLTSAQTTDSSNSSIIASLQQLILTLTQELQQLITARQQSTNQSSLSSVNPIFTATPASGISPLAVSFEVTGVAANGRYAVDFGDQSSSGVLQNSAAGALGCFGGQCATPFEAKPSHTYLNPGTYKAHLLQENVVRGADTVLGTATIIVSNNNGSTNSSSCIAFSNLEKGSTGLEVTQLQTFLGMPNVTGYYGAQTSIAYQNKCGNLGNASPTSVPGMSKYTDSDFGFSFWYPSGWSVTNSSAGGAGYSGDSLVKELQVTNGTKSVNLFEFHSPSGILYSGGKAYERVYFDANMGSWMDHDGNTSQPYYDPSKATKPADISINTMGGLHLIWYSVVPLSANDFVVVDTYGRDDPAVSLVKTIVATNLAVAIPVSTSQQIATIQAEANAYGVSANSNSSVNVQGMSLYTDPTYGFSFWYPSGWTITKQSVPMTGTDRQWDVQYYNVGNKFTLILRRPMDDGTFFASSVPQTVFTSGESQGFTGGGLQWFYTTKSLYGGTVWNDAAVQLSQNYIAYVGWVSGSDPRPLLRTMISSNAAVSETQETAAIQAEQSAYAGQ